MNLQITVSKNELQNKLKAVSKVINPSNKVIPAHSNFLFEIGTEFDVTGANEAGNITAKVECTFTPPEEKHSFCVDLKTMLDGLRELPEQQLTLIFEKKESVYSTLVIHQSGRYKIQTFSSETYSVVKTLDDVKTTVNFKSIDFLKGIENVGDFVSNDELRPAMMGIYIESLAGTLSFCAMDGAIMSVIDFIPETPCFNDFKVVIASKLARIITDLVDEETDIEMMIGKKNVSVKFGSFSIVYRLAEGNYPNFRTAIPKSNNKVLKANTSEMISSLKRISVFAESSKSPVGFHASNSNLNLINISTDATQFSDENIPVDFNCPDFAIAFEIGKVMKCMEVIRTGEFEMCFSEPLKACLITPDDKTIGLTVLIMPTMINL